MKKTIILFLLIINSVLAQTNRTPHNEIIYYDILSIPSENSVDTYLTYKIPYNRLVFEKTGDFFIAEYRFAIEVFDSSGFADRQIDEGEIVVKDFNITDSRDSVKEGFLKFNLDEGDYNFIPVFTDLKTNREVRLEPGIISVNNTSNFFKPIVIHSEKPEKCNSVLANYNGSLPFDKNSYDLVIPFQYSDEKYIISLKMNGLQIDEFVVRSESYNSAELEMCQGKISLNYPASSDSLSILRIKPGNWITEGELLITVYDESKKLLYDETILIEWFNKPKTLINRETALSLLKLIDEEMTYKYIYDAEENFDSLLYSYWKKYDPTPTTPFNELMNEFYTRADYSAINYRSFSGKSGLESDRGKIYIKYGKPVSVARISNEKGKMIEIWSYTNRVFNFIDEKGTGEFTLLDS